MNYSVEEIAKEGQRHRSTINKTIKRIGVIAVDKKCIGRARIFYYSEEQKEIILQNLAYKPNNSKTPLIVYITETFHIYESKMNYEQTNQTQNNSRSR